jgi:hypothetical protein
MSHGEFCALILAGAQRQREAGVHHRDLLQIIRHLIALTYNIHSQTKRTAEELVPLASDKDLRPTKSQLDPEALKKEIESGQWQKVK